MMVFNGCHSIGAYKTHLLSLNVDLGPQDAIPDTLEKFVNVEFTMTNSTVSRAQVRSVSVSGSTADDPPDRWVRHSARYEYAVEIEFTDRVRCKPDAAVAAYDADAGLGGGSGGAHVPRRSSRAASTERSAMGGAGRPGDRSASAPPITADDSSDESPPTDDSD